MDIESTVKQLEALGILRTSRVRGDYYSIYCPIHKDGKERKPSCGILLKDQVRNGHTYRKGFVHCFSCGYAKPLQDMVGDVLETKHIEKSGIEWLKENIPGFEVDESDYDELISPDLMASITNKYALSYIASKSGLKKEYIPEEELAKYRQTCSYVYDRGLTDEIIERYDIGFDPWHVPENKSEPVPCVTFPVRDRQGRCLFIFRRSVIGRYFNYPTGSEKPVYGLYELDPNDRTVVICESVFNALTCVRHGYNAVALFGTGNQLQIQQLKEIGARRFILAMDPDEAGKRATNKLAKNLRSIAFISRMAGFPEGKDINDLTEDEFNALTIE